MCMKDKQKCLTLGIVFWHGENWSLSSDDRQSPLRRPETRPSAVLFPSVRQLPPRPHTAEHSIAAVWPSVANYTAWLQRRYDMSAFNSWRTIVSSFSGDHMRRPAGILGSRMESAKGEVWEGCPIPSRLGGLGSVMSFPRGSGADLLPETHFSVFWRTQNTPFCDYMLMLWAIWCLKFWNMTKFEGTIILH